MKRYLNFLAEQIDWEDTHNEIFHDKHHKFYHTSCSDKKSFDGGVDINNNLSAQSKSQGKGFYLWNSKETTLKWAEKNHCQDDKFLYEFDIKINFRDFELDYELFGDDDIISLIIDLFKERPDLNYWFINKQNKTIQKFNIEDSESQKDIKKIIDTFGQNRENYFIVVSYELQDLKIEDIKINELGDDEMFSYYELIIDKEKADYGYLCLADDNKNGNQTNLTNSIESLDKYLFKHHIKERLLPNAKAFRYIGKNKITPSKIFKIEGKNIVQVQ